MINWKEYNVDIIRGKYGKSLATTPKYKNLEESVKEELGRIPTREEQEILENNLPYKIINGYAYIDNEQEIINKAKVELEDITSWFKENDWKVNKVITGEWNVADIRWKKYLEERETKRRRQDELSEILNIELEERR